ncbi:MAG TPA: hypothetical protein VF070_35875 [Streptosporangiaceae bacterium]
MVMDLVAAELACCWTLKDFSAAEGRDPLDQGQVSTPVPDKP